MSNIFLNKKIGHLILLASLLLIIVTASFLAASAIENNDTAKELIGDFGYLGVFVIALIAGLNAIIPVPVATFTPIFLAGGLSIYLIIIFLVAGTLLADLVGFFIGKWGHSFVTNHYPGTFEKIANLHQKHSYLIPYFVFFYASFVPFPNEAYLIPLGLLNVPLRSFIIPIILGTFVYITISVFGFDAIFNYFF
ncbi:hypothetical protein KC845_02890 [Candidatus Kaiserbacteria bacterium]|nr:hypothetical protein [Candidatus Kaiserbacteria bacterium]